MVAAVSQSGNRDLTLDRRKRGQAFQPGHGMVDRLTTAQSTGAMRHWGTPVIAMLTAMAALTALTADAAARQHAPRNRHRGDGSTQSRRTDHGNRVDQDTAGHFLRRRRLDPRAPVSTGTTGRETPAGVFAVLEKDKEHRSTLYDDASMPNMQRITWNGIALHGGPLPGYAASHGCVRMPFGFAEKLFDKTRIGMRVIISPNDASRSSFRIRHCSRRTKTPSRPRRPGPRRSPARQQKPPGRPTRQRKPPRQRRARWRR